MMEKVKTSFSFGVFLDYDKSTTNFFALRCTHYYSLNSFAPHVVIKDGFARTRSGEYVIDEPPSLSSWHGIGCIR